MKKLLLLIMTAIVSLFAEYYKYDISENISWQDSDGGAPVQRSLYDLVDQGKAVLITWGYNG